MIETQIDWSKIKTAHGNAAHIPAHIALLRSEDQDIRDNAYWKIDNYAVLQGDLYEAAYFIIDPLVHLLHISRFKTESIILLTEVALGYASEDDILTVNDRQVSLLKVCRNKLLSHYNFFSQLKMALLKVSDQNLIAELIDVIDNFKDKK